jgi:hypothetical protein
VVEEGELTSAKQPKQGLVLSITNPHILSQCSHWPHIIHLQPKSSGSTGGGLPAGLKTKRKRHVAKDEKVSKEVERAFAGGDCTSHLFFSRVKLLMKWWV